MGQQRQQPNSNTGSGARVPCVPRLLVSSRSKAVLCMIICPAGRALTNTCVT